MIADLDLPMIDANSDSAGVESNLEQEYRSVERSRTDIDAQLSAAKEAVENLQLQFETAKLLIAEVTTLHNTAQAMQTQIVTSNAQAAANI